MRRHAAACLLLLLLARCSVLSNLGADACAPPDRQALAPTPGGLAGTVYGIPVSLPAARFSPGAIDGAAAELRQLADRTTADCRAAQAADAGTMQGQVLAAQAQATRAQLLTLAAQLGAAGTDTEVARAVAAARGANAASVAQREATPPRAAAARAPAMAATSPTTAAANGGEDTLLSAGKSRYPSGFTPAFGAR